MSKKMNNPNCDPNGLSEEEFLASYKPKDYRHPALTCDAVIMTNIENKWQVLLIKRAFHPFINCYALPGGFVNDNESSYQACLRELKEETSISDISLSTLGMFSNPNRDPRDWVVTEAFISKVEKNIIKIKAGDDAKEAKWFDFNWKFINNTIEITLTNEDDILTSTVKIDSTFSGFENHIDAVILDNKKIAFDHALILASVVYKYLNFQQK